jgi:hypothetical protein
MSYCADCALMLSRCFACAQASKTAFPYIAMLLSPFLTGTDQRSDSVYIQFPSASCPGKPQGDGRTDQKGFNNKSWIVHQHVDMGNCLFPLSVRHGGKELPFSDIYGVGSFCDNLSVQRLIGNCSLDLGCLLNSPKHYPSMPAVGCESNAMIGRFSSFFHSHQSRLVRNGPEWVCESMRDCPLASVGFRDFPSVYFLTALDYRFHNPWISRSSDSRGIPPTCRRVRLLRGIPTRFA